MFEATTGVWNEDVRPTVRRNRPDEALTLMFVHGTYSTNSSVRLYASETSDARRIIAQLRAACDEWEALADAIDAETEPVEAAHA